MRPERIMLWVVLTLLTVSCGNQKNQQPQGAQPPQSYPTKVVHPQELTLERYYPVTIRGQEDIEIRPRIDGFIENIYIDEGSVVKKGQVLFTINSPQAVQALASARSSVENAQAELNTAQLNVERMRPLAEKGIISDVQIRTYENLYQSSQAAYYSAQAALQQAQATIGWTRVTSPVDGIAGSIPYRQGSLVSSSNVLTTIANTNTVYTYFSLNEKELLELLSTFEGETQQEKIDNMPGVSLTLADGTQYLIEGTIETISGVIDTYTGSAGLRAEFSNPQGTLRSGMSGRITIPRQVQDVMEVPQKATFTQQDKLLIYKVQGDSVVQNIITAEALPDGKSYAVTSGLSDGDRVVTDGIATLSQGKKIKAQES